MLVSSSRRSVGKAALGLLGVGLLGPGCGRDTRATAHRGPILLVRTVSEQGVSDPKTTDNESLAGWLAVATLPHSLQSELREALEALAEHLEAQAHPLGIDLSEDEPVARIRDLGTRLLPVLTAAVALTTGRWTTDGGTQVVEIAGFESRASCVRTVDSHCVEAWPKDTEQGLDGRSRRARFLAWAACYAARVRVSLSVSGRATDALRASLGEPRTTVALVVDQGLVRGSEAPNHAGIRAAARRCVAVVPRARLADHILLARLGCPPPEQRILPWLWLDTGELLVVPRLGALAEHSRFVAEVRSRLAIAGAGRAQVEATGDG